MSTYAQMQDGTFYEMSDQQEVIARQSGLQTIKSDDGWGWTASYGQDFGFASELEAWADGLAAGEVR